ncbi:hypothetical protein V6R21_18580 [Limibacter armeniacum]|uniref:hypothetical protein n=1 Tax=Limibacter armeniacum TaxID=466084 RepID=UPI002FE66103
MYYLKTLCMMLLLIACTSSTSAPEGAPFSHYEGFGKYWYKGEAEITTYELQQPRYGQMRKGHAILVMVTEPFNKTKYVKSDDPEAKDAVTVLKYNLIKRFTTGIYDYSQMESVFTPVSKASLPASLKVTYSNQDWCGQYFSSMTHTGKGLYIQHHSYFEGAETKKETLAVDLLEDELFNVIRINPEILPTGELTIIPNLLTTEMLHQDHAAHSAEASLKKNENGLMTYTLSYTDLPRKLVINFEGEAPYAIESWEESFKSSMNGQELTLKATKKKRIWSPYWNQNSHQFDSLRNVLGLSQEMND